MYLTEPGKPRFLDDFNVLDHERQKMCMHIILDETTRGRREVASHLTSSHLAKFIRVPRVGRTRTHMASPRPRVRSFNAYIDRALSLSFFLSSLSLSSSLSFFLSFFLPSSFLSGCFLVFLSFSSMSEYPDICLGYLHADKSSKKVSGSGRVGSGRESYVKP